MYVCVCICINICLFVCKHACIYVCICVGIYVRSYACVYLCIYVCMYFLKYIYWHAPLHYWLVTLHDFSIGIYNDCSFVVYIYIKQCSTITSSLVTVLLVFFSFSCINFFTFFHLFRDLINAYCAIS